MRRAFGAAKAVAGEFERLVDAHQDIRARLAPQMPPFHHILVSTAHVVTGAVILGTTLYVALRAHQLLARREASAPAPSGALAESGA